VHDVLELVGLAEQLRIVPDPAALAGERPVAAPPPAVPAAPAPRRARARRPTACGDLLQAIGSTPLVRLERLSPKPRVRIWAKLESHNPTGSIKDRVARALIADAEAQGAIWPGQTILEPTSGNTGISLALVCSRKGYRLKAVLPDNATPERRQLLQTYGAEIVCSPGADGLAGALALARELARDDPSCHLPDHCASRANALAHYDGTAPEILDEREEISAFVAGLGTGGTLTGVGRRLREELGDGVQIVAAEPVRDGFSPPALDPSVVSRSVRVTNREAILWTRRLLDEEGVFAGVSSGAAASVAVRIAHELDAGDVVFIVADDGWRYLSSGIHSRPVDEITGLDSTAWW
jgi:cysteine synthase B